MSVLRHSAINKRVKKELQDRGCDDEEENQPLKVFWSVYPHRIFELCVCLFGIIRTTNSDCSPACYLATCFRRVHKIANSDYQLRQVCPSTYLSVLSVRMEQLDSHCTDYHEIRYLNIFRIPPPPSSVISNQSTWVLYELMCWLSLVVRSPPARRSLSWIQSTVD